MVDSFSSSVSLVVIHCEMIIINTCHVDSTLLFRRLHETNRFTINYLGNRVCNYALCHTVYMKTCCYLPRLDACLELEIIQSFLN